MTETKAADAKARQRGAGRGLLGRSPAALDGARGRAAFRGAVARFMAGHGAPLAALAGIHVVVFARSLFLVSAGLFIIPWDFDGSYHRFLVFAGDCFRSGTLPIWNPFNAAGTPFFANPQSQMWSPITLLLGWAFGYTHDLAQRQLILTILLGGAGAYLLSHSLWRSRGAAFVTGLCFDLTSAVFSNLEHMDIVNAYALLPWLFWAANRAAAGASWAAPLLGFLVYWQVTWGYPAVVAIGLVCLLAHWIYLCATAFGTSRERLRFVGVGAGAALLGLGLSAVHWLPVMVHRADFLRGAPLDVEAALEASLTFGHLWGMLFNFTTATVPEGSMLDLSMVGVYFGVVALPLVVVAVVHERDRAVKALTVAAGGLLLMSMGGWFFARFTLHWLVPGFNVSRFPAADSRTLMVLSLALLAGAGARLVARDHPGSRALAARSAACLLAVLAVGMVAWRSVAYREMPQVSYFHRVVNGVTAEMLFLVAAMLLLARRPPVGARTAFVAMAVLLAVDLGTDVVLNYRVIGARVTRAEHRAAEATYRHGFDAAAATRPRIVSPGRQPGDDHDERSMQGLTAKEFYLNDYGGFRLVRFARLLDAGYSGWLVGGPRVAALPPGARPATFDAFQAEARPVEYAIAAYRPDEVRYDVRADRDSLLVFNEVAFPGWKASVDGVPRAVFEVSGGLRALEVTAGRHSVEMRFRPAVLYVGAAISAGSLVVLAAWLVLSRRRSQASTV